MIGLRRWRGLFVHPEGADICGPVLPVEASVGAAVGAAPLVCWSCGAHLRDATPKQIEAARAIEAAALRSSALPAAFRHDCDVARVNVAVMRKAKRAETAARGGRRPKAPPLVVRRGGRRWRP